MNLVLQYSSATHIMYLYLIFSYLKKMHSLHHRIGLSHFFCPILQDLLKFIASSDRLLSYLELAFFQGGLFFLHGVGDGQGKIFQGGGILNSIGTRARGWY